VDVQVWRSLDDVDGVPSSVATVGVFDGVHRGHRTVISGVVSDAQARGVLAAVVTFDPHPLAVVRPELTPPALATLEHRLALLEELGVGGVLVLPFTNERADQGPEDFVREVLVERLHVVAVHVGENFRFGRKAAGDIALLGELGQQHGFEVVAVPLAGPAGSGTPDGWSSTAIRGVLAEGDVDGAARALGRLHRVEGEVVHGDHRGRELGYPTANLAPDDVSAVPRDGVYAGWLTRASGDRLPAAISIGTNPTFGGTVRRVEAYVLDRDDLELYGEHVALDFLGRLRDTVRFDGVEPLLEQMADDVRRARTLTS
jgi:riboflavin kinase/FMN adenylyltransferase